MLLRVLPVCLLGLVGTTLAVSSPQCSSGIYKDLLPLSTFAPALAFCSARFPLSQCTSTQTVSSTVQSTVYTTSTSTVTITTGTSTVSDVSTTFTTSTYITTDLPVLTTSTVTVLTTITLAARAVNPDGPLEIRHKTTTTKPTSTTLKTSKTTSTTTRATTTTSKTTSTTTTKGTTAGNPQSSLWAVLESAGESIISVACTCIETQPPCKTVTSTTTIILAPTTLPTLTTTTEDVEATTTTTNTVTNTITSIIDVSTTSTVVVTTTVTVAEPFYSQVGGPYYGCQFERDSQDVPTTFTSINDANAAIAYCEGVCTAISDCDFVFVQYLYPNDQDTPPKTPFWACEYTESLGNTYKYDASTDLDCNLSTNVFGEAFALQNARAPP